MSILAGAKAFAKAIDKTVAKAVATAVAKIVAQAVASPQDLYLSVCRQQADSLEGRMPEDWILGSGENPFGPSFTLMRLAAFTPVVGPLRMSLSFDPAKSMS
jgi:hypothetical protein